MKKWFSLRAQSSFEFPLIPAFACGTLLPFVLYLLVSKQIIQGDVWMRYCFSHPANALVVWFACIIGCGLFFKMRQVATQLRATAAIDEALGQYVLDGQAISPSERGTWLESNWLSLPNGYRSSWVGRRVLEIVERQIKRGRYSLLDSDFRQLAQADTEAMQESYSIVRVMSLGIPLIGCLGLLIGIGNALHTPNFASDASTQLIASKAAGGFDALAIAIVSSVCLLIGKFIVTKSEIGLLTKMDGVVRDNLTDFFGCEVQEDAQPDALAPIHQMTDELLASVRELVQQQASIWNRSITEAQKQWSQWTDESGEQIRTALCGALDQSLSHHATQIEKIQQEAGRQVDSRWQQWQITLSDQARVMHAQQKELVRQTEAIEKLIGTTCELQNVETAIRDSFGSFELIEQLRQASIGVSEAVAVLASSLERSGFIRGMPVKPRTARKNDGEQSIDSETDASQARKAA